MNTDSTEAASTVPASAKTFGRYKCPECGEPFTATHHRAMFCSPAHQAAFNDRGRVQGRAILLLAKAWREGRHDRDPDDKAAAKAAFADLCRMLDEFSSEDRAASRPKAVKVLRRQQAFNTRG